MNQSKKIEISAEAFEMLKMIISEENKNKPDAEPVTPGTFIEDLIFQHYIFK